MVYMRWPEDPSPVICQASWEGAISRSAAGSDGFGYDPLFWPKGMECSAAQLSAEKKNEVSHRAQALRALLAALEPAAGQQ